MEPLAKQTGLLRRGGTYTYRVKVPLDLIQIVSRDLALWRKLTRVNGPKATDWAILRNTKKLGGIKTEIWIALGTGERAEAISACKVRAVEMDALFREVRRHFTGSENPRRLSALPDIELKHLAFLYLQRREQFYRDHPAADITPQEQIDLCNEDTATTADVENTSMWANVEANIRSLLREGGIVFDEGAEDRYIRLCNLVREASREAYERQRQRLVSSQSVVPTLNPLFNDIDADTDPKRFITVSQFIKEYLELLRNEGRSDKTLNGYTVSFNILKELLPDKPVSAVTRNDCTRVRDIMLSLPPADKRRKLAHLTLEQMAEHAKATGLERLSPASVRSYLHNLSAIFNHAEREGICDKNPAKDLLPSAGKKVQRKRTGRRPFEISELTALFQAPLYTGCEDDERGYATIGPNRPRRGRFSVPLLGLFGGLRLNEACQLHVRDIRQIAGHHCIIITEETDGDPHDPKEESDRKRVKTEAGERFVPVHPALLRMGFMQHVEKMKELGATRLFPELPAGHAGYFSDPFSKWFNGKDRFLDKLKLKRPSLCFHSLRHNYRDALHDAEVPDKYACLLGGWVSPAVRGSDAEYGRGILVKRLAEQLAKLRYVDENTGTELDLSHFYAEVAETTAA